MFRSRIFRFSVCATALSICVIGSSSKASEVSQFNLAEGLSAAKANPPERGAFSQKTFKPIPDLPHLPFVVDRHLSLLITDVDIVKQIRFSDVFEKIVSTFSAQTGSNKMSKGMLFHQLWDSENKKDDGLLLPFDTPHCDNPVYNTPIFSFPAQDSAGKPGPASGGCPRFEGNLARNIDKPYVRRNNHDSPFDDTYKLSPFNDIKDFPGFSANSDQLNSYSAVAISNRIDLASPPEPAGNGKVRYKDCGEIRVIFARNSGVSVGQSDGTNIVLGDFLSRNLIAFEARIPNPKYGVADAAGAFPSGCVALAEFFRELSSPSLTNDRRGALLKDLVLNGNIEWAVNKHSETLRPVVDYRNFLLDAGQIRTDQFLNKFVIDTVVIPAPPPPPHSGYGPPPPVQSPSKRDDPSTIPQIWTLREFRLSDKLAKGYLLALPDTVKLTPATNVLKASGPFDLPGSSTKGEATLILQDQIAEHVSELAGNPNNSGGFSDAAVADVGAINLTELSAKIGAYESVSQKEREDLGDIFFAYQSGLGSYAPFNTFIDDALQEGNSSLKSQKPLTVANMIDRLRTQTCAGCHEFSDTKTSKTNSFGFDTAGNLGGGAVWPNKGCGDINANCDVGVKLDVPGTKVVDQLKPTDHPAMQFTQLSETVLTKSVGSQTGWRYAISTTVECLLNDREKMFTSLFGDSTISKPGNCQPPE